MKHPLNIQDHNRTVRFEELTNVLRTKTGVSAQSIKAVLRALPDVVQEQFMQGNAINIEGIGTLYMRRRDYSPERRANFRMCDHASLPEFVYYPFLKVSMSLRAFLKEHAEHLNNILPLPDRLPRPKGGEGRGEGLQF